MFNVIIDGQSLELDISSEAEQVLRDQTIHEDQPGTVLRDFDSLLSFIGEGLKTTGKYGFLPQGRLDELNALMSRPIVHRLKRPQQRSFPHLHGLYMIFRASGLGASAMAPPGGHLTVDPEVLAAWRELNATERYFALLESWLVQGSPDIIGERSGWSSGCFSSLRSLAFQLRSIFTAIPDDRRGGLLYGTVELVTVAMMELFGWVRLEYGKPRDGEGVKIAMIERLPFGDAMVVALDSFFHSHPWPAYHDERPAKPGALQPLFQPFFPEWQRTLSAAEMPFREGTYTWHVSLGQAWRRIVAPAELSLDALALTILDAFDFDDEHLYCFELRDRHGRKLRIACPYEDDAEAFTDGVRLGDLPLPAGGAMKFTFDYGDNWQFTVKLEAVESPDSKLTHPEVIDRGGRAPSQYDYDWDDEE